jgi:release factor glutamine methyltransferase
MEPVTALALLRRASERLRAANVDTPRLDAEVLIMHVLGVDRATLYRDLPHQVPPHLVSRVLKLVERRARGEPVAYLTGHREFYGLDFVVTPAVFVPRPETEFLVAWAAEWILRHPGAQVCIDVGTGCGAVVIALANRLGTGWRGVLVGSDVSVPALHVARVNRDRLAPGRVELVCGDLLDWCRGPLDLVTANLPYLRPEQAHSGLAFEPATALFTGESGFGLYRRLLCQAAERLRPGAGMICEIDPSQREVASTTARLLFPRARVEILLDLAGRHRYLAIQLEEDGET